MPARHGKAVPARQGKARPGGSRGRGLPPARSPPARSTPGSPAPAPPQTPPAAPRPPSASAVRKACGAPACPPSAPATASMRPGVCGVRTGRSVRPSTRRRPAGPFISAARHLRTRLPHSRRGITGQTGPTSSDSDRSLDRRCSRRCGGLRATAAVFDRYRRPTAGGLRATAAFRRPLSGGRAGGSLCASPGPTRIRKPGPRPTRLPPARGIPLSHQAAPAEPSVSVSR